jgi:3',5'-cyclic AMP phosphodiesterase CpdA
MKKIIHFSDMHVGYKDLGARFERIIDNAIFTKEPARDYVILITGDLVEDANDPGSYEQARAHVERLCAAGFTVLPVPGNHDYGTGDLGSKQFVDAFKETFFGSTGVSYPKLDVIDGVAFIGLDSMAQELHWYDRLFAQGELGAEQLGRLEAILRDGAVAACSHRVVYLHHHPFDPRPLHELKDSDALRETLTSCGNVDALLYGHNHAGKKRNGKWGIPRCYDAGSTTRKNGTPGYHRVIDLSRDPRWDYDADFHGSY